MIKKIEYILFIKVCQSYISPQIYRQIIATYIYMDLLVDYSNIEQNNIESKKKTKNKYLTQYDETTCLYYKSHRIKKTDPITYDELTDDNSFKYEYMWDPYTGNIKDKDPYGPIYFNPINLLCHIYYSRLNGLWIGQSKEINGIYEGYYGESVGAGDNFEVIGRGIYPERYLFRLPISNCYLKPQHNMSLVTMGPKLTDDDIHDIDRLLTKKWSHDPIYKSIYKRVGSLFKLKCYYEFAISKNPSMIQTTLFDKTKKLKKHYITNNKNADLNRIAVEFLKDM